MRGWKTWSSKKNTRICIDGLPPAGLAGIETRLVIISDFYTTLRFPGAFGLAPGDAVWPSHAMKFDSANGNTGTFGNNNFLTDRP
jgi:hypothetical protein